MLMSRTTGLRERALRAETVWSAAAALCASYPGSMALGPFDGRPGYRREGQKSSGTLGSRQSQT